jgi:alcohol dehydrogenase class IV
LFYNFRTAELIIAGKNSLFELSQHVHRLGEVKSALIITSPTIKKLGFVDELRSQLSHIGVFSDVLAEVMPEPTLGHIKEIHNEISCENYDLYIGIGGGSVLDVTKLLAVLKTNSKPLENMVGTELVENRGIPTILIPTTSGTGSEVTPNAIITLPVEELKVGVISRFLLPNIAIIDPVLTLGLPKSITAATGMDAFTHSLESFISNKANPISTMFAMESIRLISGAMVTAYHEGSDLEAREKMMMGSMYGGMALSSAGTAAVHALAYPLGGRFNIPHGVANSMLLPHVMEYNMDAIVEKLAVVAGCMGLIVDKMTKYESAQAAVSRIVEWTKELHIPQNLQEFGIKEDDLSSLSLAASQVTRLLNNNPKEMSVHDIENVYRKLLP